MPRASAATGRERRGVHIVPALRVGQLVKMRQLNADDVVNAESTLPKLVSQQKNQNKQKKNRCASFGGLRWPVLTLPVLRSLGPQKRCKLSQPPFAALFVWLVCFVDVHLQHAAN